MVTDVLSPWPPSDPLVVVEGSSDNDGKECLVDGVAKCMKRLIIAARAKRMDRAVSRTRLRDARSPSVADMAILVSPCESCPSLSDVTAPPCATEAVAIGDEFTISSAVHLASVVTPGVNAPAVAGDSPLLRATKLLLTALMRPRVNRTQKLALWASCFLKILLLYHKTLGFHIKNKTLGEPHSHQDTHISTLFFVHYTFFGFIIVFVLCLFNAPGQRLDVNV